MAVEERAKQKIINANQIRTGLQYWKSQLPKGFRRRVRYGMFTGVGNYGQQLQPCAAPSRVPFLEIEQFLLTAHRSGCQKVEQNRFAAEQRQRLQLATKIGNGKIRRRDGYQKPSFRRFRAFGDFRSAGRTLGICGPAVGRRNGRMGLLNGVHAERFHSGRRRAFLNKNTVIKRQITESLD